MTRCCDCRFWVPWDKDSPEAGGDCRVRAKTHTWPSTEIDDCCGEGKPKQNMIHCSECRFWVQWTIERSSKRNPYADGDCRRQSLRRKGWPETRSDECCGEGKLKDPASKS